MGWTTIDDAAFTTESDAPLSSAHCVKVRDNAAYVSEHRAAHCGISFPYPEPVRLCSFFPMSMGPLWIYLPPGENYTEINVRIRIAAAELAGEVSGLAGSLAVTFGTYRNQINTPASDDWTEIDVGGSGLLTFSGVPINTETQLTGWIAVFIWIRSAAADDAESTGDVEGASQKLSMFWVEKPDPLPAETPPERVLVHHVRNFESGQHIYSFSHYQIERLVEGGSVDDPDSVYVMPAVTGDFFEDNSEDTYAIHACGVIPLQSVSIEAVAPDFEPSAAAFYNGMPAAEQFQVLAQKTRQIAKNRAPQWSCSPGADSVRDGKHSRLWPMRAFDSADVMLWDGAPELENTDWLPLCAAIVNDAPVDNVGYQGIISLVFARLQDLGSYEPDILFRLSAYETGDGYGGDTPIASSETVTIAFERIIGKTGRLWRWPSSAGADGSYSPMFHAILGARWPETDHDFQHRGLMGWPDMPAVTFTPGGRHDFALVNNWKTRLVYEGDVNYSGGIRLVIEAKLSGDGPNLVTTVVGGAIRSVC